MRLVLGIGLIGNSESMDRVRRGRSFPKVPTVSHSKKFISTRHGQSQQTQGQKLQDWPQSHRATEAQRHREMRNTNLHESARMNTNQRKNEAWLCSFFLCASVPL